MDKLRHSASHVMAQAVMELYKNVKLGIGPAIEDGFYYDFDLKHNFTPEDLKKIEERMKDIIKRDLKFIKKTVTKKESVNLFKNQRYKLELIKDLKGKVTIYKQGEFVDLCSGPHVKSTGEIKAFKLLKLASAYWKGDSKNKQLQRIYGTAFNSEWELRDYLKNLEESEKRDHRKLGKRLDLFSFHEEAPGMPFFHDNGLFIFNNLIDYMAEEMKRLGYEINKTPIILNKSLWLKSGHWDHYQDSMYFIRIDREDFAIKPMNCPGNLLIFKTRLHSYRELPLKAGEFGLVHRHELSGVLSGLFRVRVFTQDDAHVFCTNEQIKEQVIELIELVDRIYSKFGFTYHVELSTRPKKAMGNPKAWKIAEKALEDSLKAKKLRYKLNPGEGAFYGPKIDFHIKDALGRSWQCGTIQLDFQMPEKFDLTYEGKDGKKHRPVMIHRAIYGSLERFIGILTEHYAGKFPLWLTPVQVRIITVADKHKRYADNLKKELDDTGIRVELDDRNESISKKIRDAHEDLPFYVITIGDKEIESNDLAVRTRENKVIIVKREDLIKGLLEDINKRC